MQYIAVLYNAVQYYFCHSSSNSLSHLTLYSPFTPSFRNTSLKQESGPRDESPLACICTLIVSKGYSMIFPANPPTVPRDKILQGNHPPCCGEGRERGREGVRVVGESYSGCV